MSDLVEQIDALLALNAKGAVSHPVPGLAVELLERAKAELAARRAANTPVDGVSVKPLEWGDHDSLSIIAHTVLGPYLVEVINSPRVALWLPNMTGQARKMIEGFDSVEDAKAAAQADFNARIQSCHTSPAAEPVADSPTVIIGYTNWRGEYGELEIVPMRPWFGATDWHPEPQWLLKAWDVAKDAERDFAVKDIGFKSPAPSASRERI